MVDKKCMEWETYSFITLIKRRDNYNDKKRTDFTDVGNLNGS